MIRLRPREDSPLRSGLLSTALALAGALVLGAAAFEAFGVSWVRAYAVLLSGLATPWAPGEVLAKAAPLVLTGLAVALGCRLRLWNIGAEGQFVLGATASAWVALRLAPEAPAAFLVPACLLAGAAGGVLWALGPALLRARLAVNEVLSTLLLNYVAVIFVEYLYFGPWRDPAGLGFPGTAELPRAAWLPLLGQTRAHAGLVLGLGLAVVLWFVLTRTRWGWRATVLGLSPRAGRYAGLSAARQIVAALCLSGALAGLAGAGEVLGSQHRLQEGLASGYGFDGIIVAFLARLSPLGVIPAALFLAALMVGSDQLQTALGLPGAVVRVLEGALLLGVLAGEFVARHRLVRDAAPDREEGT